MTGPVDDEAIEAAQILCMLSMDTRQQNEDPDQTEDEQDCVITQVRPVVHRRDEEDCVITHVRPVVRPVVHRHHPYRRPGMQDDAATVARARRDAKAVGDWMSQWRLLGGKNEWNVFSLEEHEAQPDAPVPEVRRVIRHGVVVVEKVPLPHRQPCGVQSPRPSQQPLPFDQDTPVMLQNTVQQPSPLEHLPAPSSTPVQQPDPAQRPPPDQQPSSSHQPSHPYSFRALALQALLDAPESRWVSVQDMSDYVEEKYPQSRDMKVMAALKHRLHNAMGHAGHLVERSEGQGRAHETPIKWRLLAQARETATIMAWKAKQPPHSPKPTHSEPQLLALGTTPYAPRSLVLQAFLAFPEGQWMHSIEVVSYILDKYPGSDRTRLADSLKQALSCNPGRLIERSVQFKKGTVSYYRLLPGVREEATRLAWPDQSASSATSGVPE